MRDRTLAALSGVVTLLSVTAGVAPSLLASRVLSDGVPRWLPRLGTNGHAVAFYTQVASTVGALLSWTLVLGLGYVVGRRVDLPREHRRVLGAVSAGSVAALAVATAALDLAGVPLPGGAGGVPAAVTFAFGVAAYALPLVAGVLAGAALVTFESDDSAPARPAGEDDTDTAVRDGERATESGESEPEPAG